MAEIPREKLEEEIQKLAGNQARIALDEIFAGKSLGEAVWIAKSFGRENEGWIAGEIQADSERHMKGGRIKP
jgi:hypothetical protein